MSDFENSVVEILRKAKSMTSVRETQLAVVGETLANLVSRLNTKGIDAEVSKLDSVVPLWEVKVDRFKFTVDGMNLVTTSNNLDKELESLIVSDFLDSLAEEADK